MHSMLFYRQPILNAEAMLSNARDMAQDRGLQLLHPAESSALRFLGFPDDVVGLRAWDMVLEV